MATAIKIDKDTQRMLGHVRRTYFPNLTEREVVEFALRELLKHELSKQETSKRESTKDVVWNICSNSHNCGHIDHFTGDACPTCGSVPAF